VAGVNKRMGLFRWEKIFPIYKRKRLLARSIYSHESNVFNIDNISNIIDVKFFSK